MKSSIVGSMRAPKTQGERDASNFELNTILSAHFGLCACDVIGVRQKGAWAWMSSGRREARERNKMVI